MTGDLIFTTDVMGKRIHALLDSGTRHTILNRKGWDILSLLKLKADNKRNATCSV